MSLFQRKDLATIQAECEDEQSALKRSLSASNLVFLGVGGIIGAGIFVLTGQAAAQYAGPAIILSFLVSGIGCAFAALCYSELAAMIPVAGSAYTYAYATMGEFVAWIIGWDLTLEYLFGASTVAVGWSGYVVNFLRDVGIIIPDYLAKAPFDFVPNVGWVPSGAYMNLPAMLIVFVCSLLLIWGIRASAQFNNFIVATKLTVIGLLILVGMWYIKADHFVPFIPPNTGSFGHFGWSGVFRGAGVIFFAYIGFDALSTTAQECKNPQRDLPIGIIGSFIISTLLYMLVTTVIVGIAPYKSLNVPDPMAVALDLSGPALAWLKPIIKIGAVAGLSSVVLVLLMGQPRIMFTMSKDGLLPEWCSKVHSTFKTPHIITLACGLLTLIVAGLFPIGILGELVSIGTLLAFLIVCVGVQVLRYTHPESKRPFRVPYAPVVTTLGALASLVQMLSLPTDTWIRLIVWMLIGFAIYFFYGYKRSVLRHKK